MVNFSRFIVAGLLSIAGSMAIGCAAFKSDWDDDTAAEKKPLSLVEPKTDSGSVGLDVSFISVLVDKPSPTTKAIEGPDGTPPDNVTHGRPDIEQVWRWVDETAVEPNVRAELRRNGLRVGRVHTQSEFNRALTLIRRVPQDAAGKLLASAAVGSDINQASRRETCRVGKRYELPVRNPAVGQVATLVSLGGKTIGRTLDAPQPLFAITIQPSDPSMVLLKLQPEVQFGATKQTWVSNDSASALRIDSRRESWVMKDLAFEVEAAGGATLVAGAMMPPHGLGEQMFTGMTADGDTDHVLMLIRVADLPRVLAK